MRQRIASVRQRIGSAGVPPDMPPEHARYVRFNTRSVLLGLATNALLAAVSVPLWPPLFTGLLWANMVFYAALLVAALRGRHLLAKVGFNYGSWVVMVALTLALGPQYPGHWWLLSVAAYALLVYGPDERRWMAGALSLSVAGFALFETGYQLGLLPPPLAPGGLDTTAGHLGLALSSICGFSVVLAFVGLLHHYARSDEAKLAEERRRSERLLLNVLPGPIAERLKQRPAVIADAHAEVTVVFSDIVGFTPMSARLPPERLVAILDDLFTRFDVLAAELGLEKIKTIGDAYMVVAGVPAGRADHASAAARMALAMRDHVRSIGGRFDPPLDIRVGLHSGPVVAGVIGRSKFAYDLWGDTVNTASRMESSGEPGRIQVSEATAALLQDGFVLERRGAVRVKGKGELGTFWLEAARA